MEKSVSFSSALHQRVLGLRRLCWSRRDVRDAVVIFGIAIALFIVVTRTGLHGAVDAFVMRNDDWHIDDAILVSAIMSIALLVYSYRRSQEFSNEMNAHNMAELEAHRERAKSEAKIAHLVSHDAVTGLPNRTALAEHLASSFQAAKASVGTFAALCVDLDHFQGVNEFFGQSIGDSLLREVARRLRSVAGGAFIARTGGDEFILLSEGGKQPLAAASLADRLMDALAGEFEIEGQRMRVGLSIGIAIYPADGADEITLLGNADAALRRAKVEGRGSFRFFDAKMDARQRERTTLQRELRSVLKAGELVLHYQPQAQINGQIFGFEALVRWHHPTRGLLLPGEFIAVAEECGMITDIGAWVLREGCREAASWKSPLLIAVNVSPLQFRYPDLADLVRSVLSETGLAAERLELEITEGVVMRDPIRVLSIMRELKSLGVTIAMDDFGTGYSSLASLQSFPFDKIKIDREFIAGLGSNEHSTAIVRAIIGLGHNLHMPVIAEGVETEQQRSILEEEGCKHIQGYLIGRPRTIDNYSHLTCIAQRHEAA